MEQLIGNADDDVSVQLLEAQDSLETLRFALERFLKNSAVQAKTLDSLMDRIDRGDNKEKAQALSCVGRYAHMIADGPRMCVLERLLGHFARNWNHELRTELRDLSRDSFKESYPLLLLLLVRSTIRKLDAATGDRIAARIYQDLGPCACADFLRRLGPIPDRSFSD